MRRHPCEVTADRLMDHLERYVPEDGGLRDEIGRVRQWLLDIAEAREPF